MARAQILVVEDDSIIAMELEERLQDLGYSVCAVAVSGEEAIEQIALTRPDLVLMDIKLRGAMDGVEAAKEIRDRFDIPVIYLTAYADEHTVQRAKITEPYGYIIKPFEEKDLHTTVEMALYKYKMEKRLRESEQWLTTTLRSIGDAVIATDAKGIIAFMNPVAERLTGWQAKDALGQEISQILSIVSEERRTVAENPVAKAWQHGIGVDLAKHVLLAMDGQQVPIDGSTALIRDDAGSVNGLVLVFRDVSERKREEEERERLQAQLFQAQRMEAVGVLAGGIAHDFNNLMTTVIGYGSLMLSHLSEDDPMREGLESIRRAGERAAALTQQILTLSRTEMPQSTVLDLNAVIIDMEDMLQRLIGEDTDLVSALVPGFRCIKVSPAQIEQVIMNLIVNAHEAMPGGGKLTIKTENVTLDEDECRGASEAHPGTYVRLSVIDTGVGMDEETMQHIFEPFFSVRGKGPGLGLSIASTIVRQHGGWIDVTSEPRQGSTFEIYLPAFLEDLGFEIQETVPPPESQGTGERILLVEDDEGVRTAISEMLQAGGYRVVEADSAEAALDVLEREGEGLHLVFSDVVLPGSDGLQLIDEVLRREPQLPVLLTSGYTDERAQCSVILERGFPFLKKPYGLSDLLPVVREVIRGGRNEPAPEVPSQ